MAIIFALALATEASPVGLAARILFGEFVAVDAMGLTSLHAVSAHVAVPTDRLNV